MIVLVSGLPGSGKSFFAEKLAVKLGAAYINSDRVRKSMNAAGRYSLEDKLLVYKEMMQMTSVLLDQRKSAVVDATFYKQKMRNMFLQLAREKLTPLFLIYVFANEDLIRERLKTPRLYSEADFQVYEKIKEEFEEITEHCLHLESTNDNITSLLDKARAYIIHERK